MASLHVAPRDPIGVDGRVPGRDEEEVGATALIARCPHEANRVTVRGEHGFADDNLTGRKRLVSPPAGRKGCSRRVCMGTKAAGKRGRNGIRVHETQIPNHDRSTMRCVTAVFPDPVGPAITRRVGLVGSLIRGRLPLTATLVHGGAQTLPMTLKPCLVLRDYSFPPALEQPIPRGPGVVEIGRGVRQTGRGLIVRSILFHGGIITWACLGAAARGVARQGEGGNGLRWESIPTVARGASIVTSRASSTRPGVRPSRQRR